MLPAWAEDVGFSGTLYNYATFEKDAIVSYHSTEFVLEGTAGDWTIGTTGWVGLTGDWESGVLSLDDRPTVEFYAGSEAFGRVALFDTDNALYDSCITPTGGTNDFGTEDLMTLGTCAGYSGAQAVTYTSPSFGDGFTLKVSAMADLTGTIETGAVDSSLTGALGFERTVSGVDYSANIAVDAATSVKDGLPIGQALPVTVQAGSQISLDGWTFGAAAQYEANSLAGGNSWGVGAGVAKAVTEQLTLGGELAVDGYEDGGAAMREVSLGATAEYYLVPDTLSIEGSINALQRTGGGIDETVAQIGTGIVFSY